MNTQNNAQVQQLAPPVVENPPPSPLLQGTDEAVQQVALLGYN